MDGRFSFFPSLPFPFNGGNLLRNLLFIEASEVFNLCRSNLSPPLSNCSFFFFLIIMTSWKRNVKEYIFYENNLSYCSNEMALFIQPIIFRSKQLRIFTIKSNFNEMWCVLQSGNSINRKITSLVKH